MRCYCDGWSVWLWVEKPNLRSSGHLPPSAHGVRLRVRVPEESVFLSGFGAWYSVLNRFIVTLSDAEDAAWDRRLEARLGTTFVPYERLPADLQAEAHATWERIFDLGLLAAHDYFDCAALLGVTKIRGYARA